MAAASGAGENDPGAAATAAENAGRAAEGQKYVVFVDEDNDYIGIQRAKEGKVGDIRVEAPELDREFLGWVDESNGEEITDDTSVDGNVLVVKTVYEKPETPEVPETPEEPENPNPSDPDTPTEPDEPTEKPLTSTVTLVYVFSVTPLVGCIYLLAPSSISANLFFSIQSLKREFSSILSSLFILISILSPKATAQIINEFSVEWPIIYNL